MTDPSDAARPGFVAFPALEAYGAGGFRIAGRRHEGSVLIVNGVVSPWTPRELDAIAPDDIAPVIAAEPKPEFLLLGVGESLRRPPAPVADRLREAGVGLEFMITSSACRVYATLIGEGRFIATALLAVD